MATAAAETRRHSGSVRVVILIQPHALYEGFGCLYAIRQYEGTSLRAAAIFLLSPKKKQPVRINRSTTTVMDT